MASKDFQSLIVVQGIDFFNLLQVFLGLAQMIVLLNCDLLFHVGRVTVVKTRFEILQESTAMNAGEGILYTCNAQKLYLVSDCPTHHILDQVDALGIPRVWGIVREMLHTLHVFGCYWLGGAV
jgi:hypothetical protein